MQEYNEREKYVFTIKIKGRLYSVLFDGYSNLLIYLFSELPHIYRLIPITT